MIETIFNLDGIGRMSYEAAVSRDYPVVFGTLFLFTLVQAKFPIIAVDEYQDLGVAHHRMVKRLAFEGGVRLFAVGDADQSIYGFTGADGAFDPA